MTVSFIVNGEPVPKQSFRVTVDRKGRLGGFTPARVKAWQEQVAWEARAAMQGNDAITGALQVELTFHLGNRRRVDLDNLSKCVLDAMNGIVWQDDTQIVKLNLEKKISKPPSLSVKVFS